MAPFGSGAGHRWRVCADASRPRPGRRPGQGRHRAKRTRWNGQWRDPKGFRLSLAEYLHKAAKAPYGASVQALEWVEATMMRLYLGKVAAVLGGLRRMQAHSAAPSIRCLHVINSDYEKRKNDRMLLVSVMFSQLPCLGV